MTHPSAARSAWLYLAMRALLAFAAALALTVQNIYLITTVGLNPFELVLVGTVFECAILLGELPTGLIADLYGRRRAVVAGVGLLGAGLLLQGGVPRLAAVLAAELLAGLGEACMSGATDAWLAEQVGEERVGALYVRAAQLGRAAGLAAIPVSVALALAALWLPLLLAGALLLALAAALALWMPERPAPAPPQCTGRPWCDLARTWGAGLAAVRGRPLLLALLAVSLVAGAAGEGFDRLWEAHLLAGLLPAAAPPVLWLGAVSASAALASLAVAGLLQPWLARATREPAAAARALAGLQLLLVLSGLGFGLAGSLALAWPMWLARSVAASLGEPLARAWLVRQTPAPARATVLSIVSQAGALGETACGPLFGLLGARVSLRAALVAAALLFGPAAALYGSAGAEAPARRPEAAEQPGA